MSSNTIGIGYKGVFTKSPSSGDIGRLVISGGINLVRNQNANNEANMKDAYYNWFNYFEAI